MDISGLDFVLINIISYICGIATGLMICCKNKEKLLVKSRSLDNISSQQYNPPIVASAPLQSAPLQSAPPSFAPLQAAPPPSFATAIESVPKVTKITVE